MTHSAPSDHESNHKGWLLRTIGFSIAAAILIVGVTAVAVTALEAPTQRAARTRSNAAAEPADVAAATPLAETAMSNAIAVSIPTLAATVQPAQAAPTAKMPADTEVSQAKADSRRILLPAISSASSLTAASTKPIATSGSATTSRTLKPQTASGTRSARVTPTPNIPFGFYFYVKDYCHKSGENTLVVDVFVTGHGGTPPYTYYHDTEVFASNVTGLSRLTLKAPSGNPIPLKIVVADSAGQRYQEEFFYRSKRRCR